MAADLSRLRPGLRGEAFLTVAEEHTAPRVGSGAIHVLATPVMINLFEAAALAAVEHLLPPGHQSLRTVFFRLEARDERDLIGDGTHERVVVNVEKFDARVQAKLKR